jgi:putative transcriptional regulator
MDNNAVTTSFAPGILIAAPELKDPNFHQSVVLMVEHNEKGAFGVVINRPLETTMKAFLLTLKIKYAGPSEKRMLLGGPVGYDHICFVHSSQYEWEETLKIDESVSLSFSMEGLRELSEAGETDFYIFIGSSGWGPSQLDDEVSTGAWFTHHITTKLLFYTPHDTMWAEAFRSMGIDPFMLHSSHTIQ